MTLKPILEGEKQYLVPLYQRTYAWKRKHLDQLWDDLVVQTDALQEDRRSPGHFIGSLVLAPAPAVVAGGVQRWLVVDGQQRLTTLLLALAALRDHVRGENSKEANRIHRQWLVNEYQSGDDHYKLLPTQTDRSAFIACIEDGHKPNGGNVAVAYRFFLEKLAEFDDPADDHDLRRVEQAVVNRLDLVSVTAENDDNVHRIFESLNNTGMSLSLGDLLRNYLFMLLPTRAATVYTKVWAPMQDILGAENVETLAYLDLVLRGHPETRRSDTYLGQQRRFREIAHDEEAVEAEIVELARKARLLRAILEPGAPDTPADPDLVPGLTRLTTWGAEAANPVLMVLLDRRARGRGTAREAVDAMLFLESYFVRRMLCGRTAAGINRALAQAALAVAEVDDAAGALRDFLSQPRRYWPDDELLAENVAQQNFYWIGKAGQRLFVLRRLEESYANKEVIDWDATRVQIEHVLPQTATPEWLALLEPDVDAGETATDLHQRVVHRLGNLTLTGYNPDLGNKPYPEKRRILASSKFSMSVEVATQPTWGVAQIEGRGSTLAARAAAIWPGPVRAHKPDAGDQWHVVRRLCAALPEGSWTAYGDIAAVTGIHPKPLGNHLATVRVTNAWRVLRSDGTVSPEFHWTDPEFTGSPRDVLTAEGIGFDGNRADPSRRLSPSELAALIGVEVPEEEAEEGSHEHRFWIQLHAHRSEGCVDALHRLLTDWRSRGGSVLWGTGAQATCFPTRYGTGDGGDYWPWAIRPATGTVEVVFQYLADRPPFDDTEVRDALRTHVNAIPGVDIPVSRLDLRPSFSLEVLSAPEALARAIDAQEWFLAQLPASGADG